MGLPDRAVGTAARREELSWTGCVRTTSMGQTRTALVNSRQKIIMELRFKSEWDCCWFLKPIKNVYLDLRVDRKKCSQVFN